jgi:hypothetical protein
VIIQEVGVLSGRAPLAACEEAIDKEYDYCADHATKKTCPRPGDGFLER